MKKHFFAAGLICTSLLALTAKNNDPVLMNVAGKDVPLSEFEYLFHKNNSQQATPQSIDDYVGMFVDYKLKVADAEANGIDTTAAFLTEFTQFRDELAQPYLRDNAVLDSLVNQAYDHMAYDVKVSHIMMRLGDKKTIDSLHTEIAEGRITFEDAARKYSIDKPSAMRGGLMGMVEAGRYPWPFEEMAFSTAEGQISPVVNSGMGLHIIRVESRRPTRGEVNVEHIMRLTRGLEADRIPAQKALIDSIYNVVKEDPSKFEQLARELSEDPGSARRGGSLGWFGSGAMVEEFDSVAFALPVGAISEPFSTTFGFHIAKKIDARGVPALDEVRERLMSQIQNSDRGQLPMQAYLEKAKKGYKAHVYQENIDKLASMAGSADAVLDSALIARFGASDLPMYVINGNVTPLGVVMKAVAPADVKGADNIAAYLASETERLLNAGVMELARRDLSKNNPEYRNLVNEYRDGILLFEISNRNVWDKASKDKEGLEDFFKANRDKYKWEAPKFKSYIIFANSDSLVNAAVEYAGTLPPNMLPADFTKIMRDRFGRDVKVERVIAAKGENAITDYLAFGGPKPSAETSRWASYAAFGGRILENPEEAADSRGAVVSDYQAALEQEWLKKLHKKYHVKINKKALKNIK